MHDVFTNFLPAALRSAAPSNSPEAPILKPSMPRSSIWRNTMRKFVLSAFILLSVTLVRPNIAATHEGDRKADLIVDDDKVQCPAATFTSIQDAINTANPGSLIRVCPGTYREQLFVNKSLSIEGE